MVENLGLETQVKEKLSSIKDVHEKKLHEMESYCESKIFSMIQESIKETSDCIADILSYGPNNSENRVKKLCKSRINKIRELWKNVGKVEIDKKSVEEITDENILTYLLKYRDPSRIDGYLPCDGDEDSKQLVCYIDDNYDETGSLKTCSIEIYLKNLLNKYGYDTKDPEMVPEILDDLLQKWNKNGYSIFDLFFNDKFKSSEKDCINTILDLYVDISHRDKTQISLLNTSQKLWMTNIIIKIKDILDNFLEQESKNNLKYLKILLKKYIQYENYEKEFEKKLESLSIRAQKKYNNILSFLKRARDKHKTKDWDEESSTISRIYEIFFEMKLGRSVLDTGFLYLNRGCKIYGEIEKDKSYQNIYREGEELLLDNKKTIMKLLLEGTTLVDYGCYTGDKAKSLLTDTSKYIKYQPVDVDESMCDKAGKNISSLNLENIEILGGIKSSGNITEPMKSLNQKKGLTYMFTGGSIGNYQDETIEEILSKTFEPKSECNLILDYYKAPSNFEEIEKLLKCYDNPATEDWFINGLINLGMEPFFYETEMGRLYSTTDKVANNYNPFNQHNNLKLFLNEFLKFSVHYEFLDDENNKYYAELEKDTHEIIIYKYIGSSVVKCDESDILRLRKLKEFPGKIVEGFEGIKDFEEVHDIDIVEKPLHEGYSVQDSFNSMVTKKSRKQIGFLLNGTLLHYKHTDMFIPANFKEGEFYPIEISRRFSYSEIEKFLNNSGREIKQTFDDDKYKYMNLIVASRKNN